MLQANETSVVSDPRILASFEGPGESAPLTTFEESGEYLPTLDDSNDFAQDAIGNLPAAAERVGNDWLKVGQFWGQIVVPDPAFSLPRQKFTLSRSGSDFLLRNEPVAPFPRLEIFISSASSGSPSQVRRVDLQRFDASAEAEIFYTRLAWYLVKSGRFTITEDKIDRFAFQVTKLTPEEEKQLAYRANFYRKLRFIEATYKYKFLLPATYSKDDIRDVDIVFRAITEGEFSILADNVNLTSFAVNSPEELDDAPFSTPGLFVHDADEEKKVLGKQLEGARYSIRVERAALANPRQIADLRAGKSVPIRFVIFDYQLRYRFAKYAEQSDSSRRQRLQQFKNKLLKDDPDELLDLLHEPLAAEVSSSEASTIVSGWLQFYDFSDRFCAQDAVREDGVWRVPIWLTYPSGKGVNVQDAFVDVKTGVVTAPTAEHLYQAAANGRRTIWDKIEENLSKVPQEVWDRLPTDGAEQHDHYLYGTPKK
jgi:hypothetical protein